MSMFEDMLTLPNFEDDVDFTPLFSMDDEKGRKETEAYSNTIPILALKNTVLFPNIIIPITVGRKKSVKAITKAYKGDKIIGVLSQKDTKIEDPTPDDLFKVGTAARVVKLVRMSDGTITAILQGKRRFVLEEMTTTTPYLEGYAYMLEDIEPTNTKTYEALISTIKDKAKKIIKVSPNIPSEAAVMLENISKNTFLLNFIASNLGSKVAIKQSILEINDLEERAKEIIQHMENEFELLKLKNKIEDKVKGDIEKQQRDYFLNQQLKTIQEELGQSPQQELEELEKRAKGKKWTKTVQDAFVKELKKARRMNPVMGEYGMTLNYLELLVDLPWGEFTAEHFDLKEAKAVLDRDHFGLDKVKDRILEHLAVLKLKGNMKSPIVCLVGPPGVGKTSLGKSIAEALGRKYVRMSLGGLHDESEIRGHRKTYIGAMPGRIIQSLKKLKTSNPVFILDEIDKVGKDFRGDPASALLEVLDPEQNGTFHDNYLDLEYDLSKILFIATANTLNTIQPALLDRMEIIEVSGYSLEEKVAIARNHLIPKQLDNHGLTTNSLVLEDGILAQIIQAYTRESGVRELSRQLANVMRGIAKKVAMEEVYEPQLTTGALSDLLGIKKYSNDLYQEKQPAGVAVGLAWTRVGGDILFIEASISKGKGKLTLTGNLGDVMKESATTALSFLKAKATKFGIDDTIFDQINIHVHVPQGAIPKDGPSAGITMLTALTSALTKRPVKPFLAMTGEITLRGKVLPVGGIKEKILAAKRAGITEIILCKDNKKHISEIKSTYIEGLFFHFVEKMEEVLDISLSICSSFSETLPAID